MRTLNIDIETFSSNDLSKSGVYKYVEAPDFEIILFGYSIDGEPVTVIDLVCGEELPDRVLDMLTNPHVQKKAHNAQFERVCINKYFGIKAPASQWHCTMVKASALGLPFSLDQVSKVLKLTETKDPKGGALIRYFSIPCKPTKANEFRTRNMPWHDMERWREYIEYNRQDVVVELEIDKKTDFFETPASERELWILDQEINDRGVLHDPELVKNAMKIDSLNRQQLIAECTGLTGIANPNSVKQVIDWIRQEEEVEVQSLAKDVMPDLINSFDSERTKRVLRIKSELSKSSIKKYQSIVDSACSDNRVRGMFQFNGANRTGRWAGHGVQLHNLVRNDMKDLDFAREVVLTGDYETMDLLFPSISNALSQLIRTAFIPKPGCKLVVSDFSAIEARVVAWLANEQWRLDVFNTHGKIYEASAAKMFKVPIESVTKGSDLRTKGKISELALGYQGSKDALIRMGALEMGLSEDELQPLVNVWRAENRKIVRLWADVNEAAITVVRDGVRAKTHYCEMYMNRGIFFIKLPSGRVLSYLKPQICENRFGMDGVEYMGLDQTTKQWTYQDTYGGKLVENITQAIARDVLAYSMVQVEKAGFPIVIHVHDEIVTEVPTWMHDAAALQSNLMSLPVPWVPGLPLKAESFESLYYKKE